jgi:hypothetical protein
MDQPTLLGLAVTLLVVGAALLLSRRARRRRRGAVRVQLGADAAKFRRDQTVVIGDTPRQRRSIRVLDVDVKRGFIEVEPIKPPTAAERGAKPKEAALLRALGFDPATHDVMPVARPHRGVQVLRNGERVRFFTHRQVRERAGAWKTALRTQGGAA